MDRMRSVLECFLRASATAMGRSPVFFSQRSSGLLRRKTRTTNDAYVRYLNYINKDISSCYGGKENMFSVRCVKD